jgi:hypothetical protein
MELRINIILPLFLGVLGLQNQLKTFLAPSFLANIVLDRLHYWQWDFTKIIKLQMGGLRLSNICPNRSSSSNQLVRKS